MSNTAIGWVILYVGCALGSFLNPVFGMLGYLLEYYMRPSLQWWGDEIPKLQYNLIISVIFGLSYILRKDSLRKMAPSGNPIFKWFGFLLAIMIVVSASTAANHGISAHWTWQWTKIAIIIPLLIAGTVRSQFAFDAFAVAHMLGGFWWGWNAWINPHRKMGRLENVGSGDSRNDNAASIHLLTVLPMIVIYLLTEKNKKLKTVALIAAPFVINTIILCNSRGAMLGVAMMVLMSFSLIPKGYRLKSGLVAVAGIAVFLTLADPQFFRRQQTTADPHDSSAMQRLDSWMGGLNLVKANPFGVGGRGFHLLSPKYIPSVVESHGGDLRAPHNTYVMVTSEWGIAGLICFLGMMASTFLVMRTVKKRAPDRGFYYWRAVAIQLAVVGVAVSQTFTDRLYGEALYWICGLGFALYRMQQTDLAEAAAAPSGPNDAPAPVEAVRLPGRARPALTPAWRRG